jgi:hypothetical protein
MRRISVYSDARNVLTGVLDYPDTVSEIESRLFVSVFVDSTCVCVLLQGVCLALSVSASRFQFVTESCFLT